MKDSLEVGALLEIREVFDQHVVDIGRITGHEKVVVGKPGASKLKSGCGTLCQTVGEVVMYAMCVAEKAWRHTKKRPIHNR